MTVIEGGTALVTGAASGIGREISLALAEAGARVICADIDRGGLDVLDLELRENGAVYRTFITDVSDAASVAELARQVEGEFGGPDILVNNAGVFVWGDIVDTTLDDWRWLIGVNLMGPAHSINAFHRRSIHALPGR